jgi:hypothetical protein
MHLKYCCTTPDGLMDPNKYGVALGKTSLVSRTIQRPEPVVMEGYISSKQICTNLRIFLS